MISYFVSLTETNKAMTAKQKVLHKTNRIIIGCSCSDDSLW